MSDRVPFNRLLPGMTLEQIKELTECLVENKSEVVIQAIEQIAGELSKGKGGVGQEAKRFNVRLPLKTKQLLEGLAKATGATETQIIIIAIDRLSREKRGG